MWRRENDSAEEKDNWIKEVQLLLWEAAVNSSYALLGPLSVAAVSTGEEVQQRSCLLAFSGPTWLHRLHRGNQKINRGKKHTHSVVRRLNKLLLLRSHFSFTNSCVACVKVLTHWVQGDATRTNDCFSLRARSFAAGVYGSIDFIRF